MSTLALPNSIIMEVLARSVRPEKEIKGIHIGKELKLFVENMALYIENPRKFTEKRLELINSSAELPKIRSI